MKQSKKIRWGLLGAGILLDRWMKGARQVEDAEIVAVASRTMETARRQAEKFHIPEAMTYEEMLARDDLDVLYIPVPHTAHRELAIRAMEAGRNVLVEKPAGISLAEWEEMTACAKRNGVFLMEAMWTRTFPATLAYMKELREGVIGDVRMVQAAFSFRVPDDYQGRLTDPALAGGALFDVGVYVLHFAQMVYGRAPVSLIRRASRDTDHLHLEVDEQDAIVGQYDDGALSLLFCGIRTEVPDTAYIYGTNGSIVIPHFWKPSGYAVICGDDARRVDMPIPQKIAGVEDEGYQFEIAHVCDCIREGFVESPLVPHAVTAEVLRQCDLLVGEKSC